MSFTTAKALTDACNDLINTVTPTTAVDTLIQFDGAKALDGSNPSGSLSGRINEAWDNWVDKKPSLQHLQYHWKLYFYLTTYSHVQDKIADASAAAPAPAPTAPAPAPTAPAPAPAAPAPAPAAAAPTQKDIYMNIQAVLEHVIKALIEKALESLQTKAFEGGKAKKGRKTVRGGQAPFDMAMISNTSGLFANTDPITAASQHVPTLLNIGSPVTGGLNTDFVDSTKGVSSSVMRTITPNLGGPVKTTFNDAAPAGAGAQSGGRAKPKSKK